ncbi:hypothetical protein [Actinophytocola glycyrrhizae]|uniref:Uncharacterized protein n=1 Tax=Actinophytocola glycyrrhizae TaxID=2044873 RepID=A0ABV9RVM2_9PSEU
MSHHQGDDGTDRTAAEHLRALGFAVTGSAEARGASTAWLEP